MSNGTPRDWEELKKLAERLRGTVRVPITDGLGAVGGGDEPDNPDEFVRTFQTPPIQHEAADAVLELIAEVDAQHRAYQAAMSALNKSGEELSQLKAERDRMAEALGLSISAIKIAAKAINGKAEPEELEAIHRAGLTAREVLNRIEGES